MRRAEKKQKGKIAKALQESKYNIFFKYICSVIDTGRHIDTCCDKHRHSTTHRHMLLTIKKGSFCAFLVLFFKCKGIERIRKLFIDYIYIHFLYDFGFGNGYRVDCTAEGHHIALLAAAWLRLVLLALLLGRETLTCARAAGASARAAVAVA